MSDLTPEEVERERESTSGMAGMAIAFVCWLAVVMLLIFLTGLPYFMRGAQ